MNIIRTLTTTGTLVACIAISPTLAAQTSPQIHVRGTITAVRGNAVTIATSGGNVVVTLSPKTKYVGVVPGTVDEITSGTFIGTANVPGPGSASRALEVVVFPKALAGTGEGDYAWDLPAGGGHMSAMTNGTVMTPKKSMMTNATVTHVQNGPIKTVRLAYKGGTKTVSIPPGAPIVDMIPATKSLVVVGAHVVAFPPNDAVRVIAIGEKGAIPPM